LAAQAAATEVMPRSARQAMRALQASEAKFRALLEAAPDAMMIHGADGRIQIVNAQAEALFGYRRDELIGQTMEMLMPERFRKNHVRHRQSYTRDSAPRPMGSGLNLLALHKDGREIPVEISLSNLESEEEPMVISSIRDITERKRAERVVRLLNEELEKRVEERTIELRHACETIQREMTTRRRLEQEILEISERERRLIGQDLHDDLGQRLAGAWCLSQALENDLQAGGSPAAGSAARVTETLQNALALTRSLARGLYPVAIEAGGLGAALKDLAARTGALFPVRCRCRIPSEMPDLDPVTATHVYRIAQESITNAVKHGRATHIEITLRIDPPEAVLTIQDDGCGLPQVAATAEGMGLRIMPYRADIIGGRLNVAAADGGGTVVTCTFPAAPTATQDSIR
jgi:two-component system, LuxR family, sensor kinase FixL